MWIRISNLNSNSNGKSNLCLNFISSLRIGPGYWEQTDSQSTDILLVRTTRYWFYQKNWTTQWFRLLDNFFIFFLIISHAFFASFVGIMWDVGLVWEAPRKFWPSASPSKTGLGLLGRWWRRFCHELTVRYDKCFNVWYRQVWILDCWVPFSITSGVISTSVLTFSWGLTTWMLNFCWTRDSV